MDGLSAAERVTILRQLSGHLQADLHRGWSWLWPALRHRQRAVGGVLRSNRTQGKQMTFALLRLVEQLKHKHTRRRFVEKTLHRWGMSRRRALKISRHIP